ncbi:MAG: dTDP-4-dehydrorhamnose 3,5-epimerase [bacterium]
MTVEKTQFDGLLVIKPDVFRDTRGYFYESFNKNKFIKVGLSLNFEQDNISRSAKGTIRGLHYQVGDNAQGKLCSVLLGKVFDVAVDIRFGSPTFGKHFRIELSDENNYQLWIPPGFAHGFCVLSDEAIFHYKCTALYNKESERSILFSDNDIAVDWGIENPIVSEKDQKAKLFKDIQKDFIYNKNL